MKKKLLSGRTIRWSVFSVLGWALGFIALVSTLILDHISWKKGERSYVFTGPRVERVSKPAPRIPEKPAETARKPETPAPAPETKAIPKEKPGTGAKPKPPSGRVALVIDDMGNSLEALDEILALGKPITVSVLPYGEYAVETARIAHDKGLEVFLHLPLESLNNHESESSTRGLILSGMSPEEIRILEEEDIDRIPFIRGVNNHMGSKVTADESLMRLILEPIKKRGLVFLDSRTIGKSVAYDVARSMGVPTAYRQVFLDAEGDGGRVKERLLELFRLARRDGRAVGICHPYAETLRVLKDDFRLLESYGLTAVFVSELATR
jgi:polysaccharide deacetylase 2 family uncharacterized protein YibQ